MPDLGYCAEVCPFLEPQIKALNNGELTVEDLVCPAIASTFPNKIGLHFASQSPAETYLGLNGIGDTADFDRFVNAINKVTTIMREKADKCADRLAQHGTSDVDQIGIRTTSFKDVVGEIMAQAGEK